MTQHLDYCNLKQLLEYLNTHSYTSKAEYGLKIQSSTGIHPEHSFAVGPIEPSVFEMTVQGSPAIRKISEREGTLIRQIVWRNLDSTVIIDCIERSIFIKTSSLSFAEICRHKLSHQGVSKILVDLKPR